MNAKVDKQKNFAIIKENGIKNSMPPNETPSLKTNGSMGSCNIASEVTEEDFEKESQFVPGNIVWAQWNKQWWPGFVEDDPDRNEYCWIESGEEYYNVTFFGDKVSRSKIAAKKMELFDADLESIQKKVGNHKKKRLSVSIEKARDASKLTTAERLEKYSFVVLYNGYIGPVSDDDDLPSVSSKSNGIVPYKRKDIDSDSSSLPPKVKKSRSSNRGRRSPADSDIISIDGDSSDGRPCCSHCKARIAPEPAPIARPTTCEASTMTDPPPPLQDASTLVQDNVLEERMRALAAEHRAILASFPEPDHVDNFILRELDDEESEEEGEESEKEEESEEEEEERRCVTPIEQIRAYNEAVKEDQCAIFSDYVKY